MINIRLPKSNLEGLSKIKTFLDNPNLSLTEKYDVLNDIDVNNFVFSQFKEDEFFINFAQDCKIMYWFKLVNDVVKYWGIKPMLTGRLCQILSFDNGDKDGIIRQLLKGDLTVKTTYKNLYMSVKLQPCTSEDYVRLLNGSLNIRVKTVD